MSSKCFILLLICFPPLLTAQTNNVTISGLVKNAKTQEPLPFANVTIRKASDTTFLSGTITNEQGRFALADVAANEYVLTVSLAGYKSRSQQVLAGKLSKYFDLGVLELDTSSTMLDEVIVSAIQQDELGEKMDRKSYAISNNISQQGGSVLQAMKNLPGVTISDEGKVQLRGSDKVTVLLDGKQTALTGIVTSAPWITFPLPPSKELRSLIILQHGTMLTEMPASLISFTKRTSRKDSTEKLDLQLASVHYGKKNKIFRPFVRNTRQLQKSIHRCR